jgi:diguanylate cyclase (GGDEF)-like protein
MAAESTDDQDAPKSFAISVRDEAVKGVSKKIADRLVDWGWDLLKWIAAPFALIAAAYFHDALGRQLSAPLWQVIALFGIGGALCSGLLTFWLTRRSLAQRYTKTIADLTGRVETLTAALKEKTRDANTDDITGIPNSRAFQEHLPAAFEGARQREKALTVIVIDLDNFKQVNDLSPSVADDVLREFATSLQQQCRRTDMVFRYKPGDEFLLMAPETPAEPGGRGFANRLRNFFKEYDFRGRDGSYFRITFSAGVADARPADDPDDTWTKLVSRGEAALRRAKTARNTFEVYDPELDERRRTSG